MNDALESVRRTRLAQINSDPKDREALAAQYGQVWNTEELAREFEVLGYLAPFVVVRRTSDGRLGSLEFQHDPRYYFSFQLDPA
jgi:hypothetical protein